MSQLKTAKTTIARKHHDHQGYPCLHHGRPRLTKNERAQLRRMRRRVLRADQNAIDTRVDSGAHLFFLQEQEAFHAIRFDVALRLRFSWPASDPAPTVFLRVVAGNKLAVAKRIVEARKRTNSPLFRLYR